MRSRGLFLFALAGCGARTTLEVEGTGGSTTTVASTAVASSGTGPTCALGDMATWRIERYRDEGDYERFATAVAGEPWVALKVKGGNIVLEKLRVETAAGIVVEEKIEIPDTPVYPLALDVDARRFVLLTASGLNFNGELELVRVDRLDGSVLRVPVGPPPSNPASTIFSAIVLAQDDVLLAYSRPNENVGAVELRSDQLQLGIEIPTSDASFVAVRPSETMGQIYAGANHRYTGQTSNLQEETLSPPVEVIGGLHAWRVEIDDEILLTHGADVWSAPWPHTQISPPAVVRIDGANHAAFTLETELTAVVGHVSDDSLQWLEIEPAPDASGLGVAIMPVLEPGRLGLFYLGLEVPKPEQPLRYYGLECH